MNKSALRFEIENVSVAVGILMLMVVLNLRPSH